VAHSGNIPFEKYTQTLFPTLLFFTFFALIAIASLHHFFICTISVSVQRPLTSLFAFPSLFLPLSPYWKIIFDLHPLFQKETRV